LRLLSLLPRTITDSMTLRRAGQLHQFLSRECHDKLVCTSVVRVPAPPSPASPSPAVGSGTARRPARPGRHQRDHHRR
jgi:hypothetical protein